MSGTALQTDFGAVGAGPLVETPQWYAIRTRSRHEKIVADQLEKQSIEGFLPLVKRTRKWSDRTKEVELPLFSGYTFPGNIIDEAACSRRDSSDSLLAGGWGD